MTVRRDAAQLQLEILVVQHRLRRLCGSKLGLTEAPRLTPHFVEVILISIAWRWQKGGAMSVVSDELMEILRCPVAVHYKDKGDDPGRLRLVQDCWLVCDDSGYKYPIREGIPVMLVDEGEKWKDTAEENLPVPPPEA